MELRHLRYFAAVAETENISQAAERLHVSQPPLSRQIRQLEDELGVALFERSGKAIKLTRAGKAFAREAERILFMVDKAVAVARTAGGVEPRELRIGYAPSLTVEILPHALETFHRRHTGVKVRLFDLDSAEMIRKLRDRALDVGLIIKPGKGAMRGFEFRELRREPVCVVLPVSHPLAGKEELEAEAVVGERFLGFTHSTYPEYRQWLGEVFSHLRRRPLVTEEHDSISGLIAAVEAGRGITVGGGGIKEMVGSRLCVRKLAPPVPPIRVGALYLRDQPPPVVVQFLDCIA
ncbi:MAG: LysR family transcriptional regulator [Puniceicoccaceae bacterium]|nr:MAG: LysR family transcriptional regulator [Puniceicoccaceae bacterium]